MELPLESWYGDSSVSLSDLACSFYEVLKKNIQRRFPLVSVNIGNSGVPISRFRDNAINGLLEVMDN